MAHLPRLIALAALVAASCCASAYAQALPAVTYPAPGVGTVTPGPLNYMPAGGVRAISLASDGVRIIDTHAARVAANDIAIQQGRNLTARGIVTALGRVGSRAVPIVGTVAALVAAWCEFGGQGAVCDPMQAKTSIGMWRANEPSAGPFKSSPEQATAAQIAAYGYRLVTPPVCSLWGPNNGNCSATVQAPKPPEQGGGWYPSTEWNNSVTKIGQTVCPAVPGLPGYTEPGGPPDAQGNCPTGTKVPATDPMVDGRIVPALLPGLVPITQRALTAGIPLDEAIKPGTATLTGPSPLQLPPVTTTTTSPTGQPATTTTQQQLTLNYNPVTNNFTWTTTTTTTQPDGTTETKEEVPKEQEDKRSECEKNPTSLACADTDTPDVPDIDSNTLNVSVAADAGWGVDNASCPAPATVYIQGRAVQVDNTVYCGFFGGIRPVVIAVFSLAGALIFLGGLKS